MSKFRQASTMTGRALVLVTLVSASAVLVSASASVWAADWRPVINGKTETIEIDRDRITAGSGGTLGWSRIRLQRSVNDPSGPYNAIYAQNLYDCQARKFTTLQRAYFNGDTLVREEAVSRQRANAIMPGSIDERLLTEACRNGGGDALVEVENKAIRAAAEHSDLERLAPMHADVRSLHEASRPRVIAIADAPGGAGIAAEKPKRIEMPVIDKAAATASAAASAAQSATAAAAAPVAPVQAPAAPVPQLAIRPPPAHSPTVSHDSGASSVDKRARELQLATSGPVRKKKAKPVENPAKHMQAHWSYEGEGGPANWSKLEPGFATCASGKRQSPIDIREGLKLDLSTIKFDYRPTLFQVVDNGHTIQVNMDEGQSITVLGQRFDLLQFHFHKPSEERVNGRSYDMVVHLVHKNEDGKLAVIAVLLERGTEHPVIQSIWNNLPLEKKSETSAEVQINLMNLLPDNRAYWTYMGSLTTPPCSENVLWMVLKQPAQVSPEQVAIFSKLYRNNARPIQPANGRLVKESR